MLNVVSFFFFKELLVLLNTRQKVLLRAALKYLEGWGRGVMDSAGSEREENLSSHLLYSDVRNTVVQTSLWGLGYLVFIMARGWSKPWV